MSTVEHDEPDLVEDPEDLSLDESLSSRMHERAAALYKERTDFFPLPGRFEDLIEVEMRALPAETTARIAKRAQASRVAKDRLELTITVDSLIAATVGFRQVLKDGRRKPIPDDWMALARRTADCPEPLSPRVAFWHLVDDTRILGWSAEYQQWVETRRPEVEEEVARDFGRTG